MDKRKNWSLIIALSLPLVMIVAVTLSIYIPSRWQHFEGQFVYSIQENGLWYGGNGLAVINGKLQEQPLPRPSTLGHSLAPIQTPNVHIYLHDVAKNESQELTLEQAKRLNLDASPRSGQGHQIAFGSSDSGVLVPLLMYSRTDYAEVYVQGEHGGSKRLNVRTKAGAYYNQFQFLGWVKP